MKKLLIFAVILLSSISCKKDPPTNIEKMEGNWKLSNNIKVSYYDGHQMSTANSLVLEDHQYSQGKITKDGQQIGSYTGTTVTYYEHDTVFQIISLQQDTALVIDQCPDGIYNGQKITGASFKKKFYRQ